MRRLYLKLLLLLATATDRELAKQLQFVLVENRILRHKLPKQISLSERERQRLIRFGKPLGAAIKQLITIVSPRTFARWLQQEKEPGQRRQRSAGRPPTSEEGILRARENAWGHTRIHGELKKLGIRNVSRTTVANILRAHGIDPGPERGEGTWADFIERHARTLWACDFFSVKVWTLTGLREYFVLFFLHVGSRRVHIAGMTTNPDHAWVAERVEEMQQIFALQVDWPTHLIRDLDGKYGPEFDAVFSQAGIEVVPVGPRAPNLSAYAERWVLSIKSECLDHFLIFGEGHLRRLVHEYVSHYLLDRAHQGVGNVPLTGQTSPQETALAAEDIVCHERLGGLLKSYGRRAA